MAAALEITRHWKLRPDQSACLLGVSAHQVRLWKRSLSGRGLSAPLPKDTVERISYLLGIWASLALLFPDPAVGARWLRRSNAAAVFNGDMPLRRLLGGNVADLYVVRRYLDGIVNA